jgi:hypothetical protein
VSLFALFPVSCILYSLTFEEFDMKIPLYQIDAFATSRVFAGNPAAVCPLRGWLEDGLMQAIAQENNLSETAFFVPLDQGYHIRWFTPAAEVDLCGHATLASAYVLFTYMDPSRKPGDIQIQKRPPDGFKTGRCSGHGLPCPAAFALHRPIAL